MLSRARRRCRRGSRATRRRRSSGSVASVLGDVLDGVDVSRLSGSKSTPTGLQAPTRPFTEVVGVRADRNVSGGLCRSTRGQMPSFLAHDLAFGPGCRGTAHRKADPDGQGVGGYRRSRCHVVAVRSRLRDEEPERRGLHGLGLNQPVWMTSGLGHTDARSAASVAGLACRRRRRRRQCARGGAVSGCLVVRGASLQPTMPRTPTGEERRNGAPRRNSFIDPSFPSGVRRAAVRRCGETDGRGQSCSVHWRHRRLLDRVRGEAARRSRLHHHGLWMTKLFPGPDRHRDHNDERWNDQAVSRRQ